MTAALSSLEVAFNQNSQDIAVAMELGQILVDLKRSGEATVIFQRCIAHHPTDADLRLALGAALLEHGEPANAAAVFLKASRLAPARLTPRMMLTKSLFAAKRHQEALSILHQTAQNFPDVPEIWAMRGTIERELNDTEAAAQSFRKQVLLAPNDSNALNNLGVALRALHRVDESITLYRQALALAPDSALAHANLGNALDATGDTAAAEFHLRQAATLDPTSTDCRYNFAAHLVRMEKPDESVSHMRHVISVAPQRWDAWTNLGVALVALGELEEAESCYRAALKLRPTTPEPHYNLAWLLLLSGRWQEGWREYEWRWQLPHLSILKRQDVAKAWDGSAQPASIILIQCEQGLGDSIQFVRLAKHVRALCRRVIVECPPSLASLFSSVDGIDQLVPQGSALPHHDFSCYLLSLPGLLGLTPDAPKLGLPYIAAPQTVPSHLVLAVSHRPKIGFVWAGSPDNKIDRRRSCDVRLFKTLFDGLDVDVVSLQTGPKAGEMEASDFPGLVFDINGRVTDWADTASIISQLDLIIGVDTAVIHLAGALGMPAWVLLPSSPDFRWFLERTDTPWYSSIFIYRQRVRGDWPGVFSAVRTALTKWLDSRV